MSFKFVWNEVPVKEGIGEPQALFVKDGIKELQVPSGTRFPSRVASGSFKSSHKDGIRESYKPPVLERGSRQ